MKEEDFSSIGEPQKDKKAGVSHNKKLWLIRNAIKGHMTLAKNVIEAEKEYRCYGCAQVDKCEFAWDGYNIGPESCLAEK